MRITLVLFVALLASAPVAAADWVRGIVTVEGVSIQLRHVTTYYRPTSFVEGKWDLCALFSDTELPLEAVPSNDEGLSKYLALLREEKIHSLVFCFDTETKDLARINDVTALHLGISMGRYTYQGFHAFEAKLFSADAVEGKVRSKGNLKTFDDNEWSNEIEFAITIPPRR